MILSPASSTAAVAAVLTMQGKREADGEGEVQRQQIRDPFCCEFI